MSKDIALNYISPQGTTGWIVRVPYAYFYDNNTRTIRYKQKSFTFLMHDGAENALLKAKEFRDLHKISDLKYKDRSASGNNGRQVMPRKVRIRGLDLPVGITDSLRLNRQGNERTSIDVQAMCGKVSRTKCFMYGHIRTREEAIKLAEKKLEEFLNEIEDSLS